MVVRFAEGVFKDLEQIRIFQAPSKPSVYSSLARLKANKLRAERKKGK